MDEIVSLVYLQGWIGKLSETVAKGAHYRRPRQQTPAHVNKRPSSGNRAVGNRSSIVHNDKRVVAVQGIRIVQASITQRADCGSCLSNWLDLVRGSTLPYHGQWRLVGGSAPPYHGQWRLVGGNTFPYHGQ